MFVIYMEAKGYSRRECDTHPESWEIYKDIVCEIMTPQTLKQSGQIFGIRPVINNSVSEISSIYPHDEENEMFIFGLW